MHLPVQLMVDRTLLRLIVFLFVAVSTSIAPSLRAADFVVLEEISHIPLEGDGGQFRLRFSGLAPKSGAFTIDNPARLAIDLPDTRLGKVEKNLQVDAGVVKNVRLVQAGNRTRVVFSLDTMVPYEIRDENNAIYVSLKGGRVPAPQAAGKHRDAASAVTDIDFHRVANGEGRVIVHLSDANSAIDLQTQGNRLVVDILGARFPEGLVRRLDVADFATPVNTIDSFNREGNARLVINPVGDYEHLAYQVGNVYTIDIKPVTPEQKQAARSQGEYSGDKLSLNFQNIEVRAVLQLLGDFTGLNIVASDSVQGNITLRLRNVPWDQALDIILKSKGLGMRKNGPVVMIAPAEEIAAREKQELEARQQLQELAPLRTEFFQINYAKASEIANLLKDEKTSLLSARGNVTIDERTNTVMVLDSTDRLDDIRGIVERLDVPIRQVLIESRIVIANDDYSKTLGARFGVTNAQLNNNGVVATTGSVGGTDTMVNSAINNAQNTGQFGPIALPQRTDRLNVNLPVVNPAGQLALAILDSDYLVDLELSALQTEGKGEVVSSPRVVTSNQKEAVIQQGVEVPYQQATSSGATAVAFKKAVLSLSVTPQITPDDRVIMDLRVSKDSVGDVVLGVPTINTRAVNTQVLVNNGETVVLGGIYEQTRADQVSKVPLLGDIPVLGALFRHTRKVDDKAELLIFVTPKVLKDGLRAQFQ